MELYKQIHFLLFTSLFSRISIVDCLKPPYQLVILPEGAVRVREGDDISLLCSVHMNGRLLKSAQDMFKPIWKLPVVKAMPSKTVTKVVFNSILDYARTELVIKNVKQEDSGVYICSFNIAGWNMEDSVLVTVQNDTKDLELSIQPSQEIQISEGDSLKVFCSANRILVDQEELFWESSGKVIKQTRVIGKRVILEIDDATKGDAGRYICRFDNGQGPPQWKALFLSVVKKGTKGSRCGPRQFMCKKSKYCIFSIYRCNGQEDCNDGSDEKNCGDDYCKTKFMCKNGKCIDKDLECDRFHGNNCGDWSDEQCLDPESYFEGGSDNQNEEDFAEEEENMTWLKTTVYAVIGCLVSIVLIISIIVIVIFRFRMKKEALRQSELALERRQVEGRVVEDELIPDIPPEQQPFIAGGSSRPSFGNIIVNVNNGVQFVPGTNFRIMDAPPSYSDVEQEINEIQNIPPPDYSTVDRNPQRPGFLQLVPANNNISNDTNNNSAVSSRNARQNITPTGGGNSRHDRPQMQHVSVQTTQSQTRGRNCADQSGLQRNNSSGNQTRAKRPNIDVQGGQIILTDQQLATVPGHTQTVNTNSNRPAQIQVQGGQIVFSSGNTSRGSDLPSVSTSRVQNSPSANTVTDCTTTPVVTSVIQPAACVTNDSLLSGSASLIEGQGDSVCCNRSLALLSTPITEGETSLSEQATLQCRPNSAPVTDSVSWVHDEVLSENLPACQGQNIAENPPLSQSSSNVNSVAVLPTTSENDILTLPISSSGTHDFGSREDNSIQNSELGTDSSDYVDVDFPESNAGHLQLQIMGGRILLSSNQNTFPSMSSSHRTESSARASSPNQGQINVQDGNIMIS